LSKAKEKKESSTTRPSTRFLKRYLISSDDHEFIGRIYDLSIVELNFETYEELIKYPDCKYVFHINYWLHQMVRRVESLNMAGDLLWLDSAYIENFNLPVTQYQWLTIAADIFLMRFISIADSALLLTNEVFETDIKPQKCTIQNLQKSGVPKSIIDGLKQLQDDHLDLRQERNIRFHRGIERELSSDDQTFRMASMFEKGGQPVKGQDQHNRRISTKRYLKEGLVRLQRDFNVSNRKLSKGLDHLYDLPFDEFEKRFSPKFNDPQTGFGAKERSKRIS